MHRENGCRDFVVRSLPTIARRRVSTSLRERAIPFVQYKRPLQFVSLYKGGPRNGGGVSRAYRRASASAGCAIVIPLFLDSTGTARRGAARPKSEPGADLIRAPNRITDEINRGRPKRKIGTAGRGSTPCRQSVLFKAAALLNRTKLRGTREPARTRLGVTRFLIFLIFV